MPWPSSWKPRWGGLGHWGASEIPGGCRFPLPWRLVGPQEAGGRKAWLQVEAPCRDRVHSFLSSLRSQCVLAGQLAVQTQRRVESGGAGAGLKARKENARCHLCNLGGAEVSWEGGQPRGHSARVGADPRTRPSQRGVCWLHRVVRWGWSPTLVTAAEVGGGDAPVRQLRRV